MSLGGNSFVPEGATKGSWAEDREHQQSLFAKRIMEVPSDLQIRQAISRSDGQPDYVGYAPRGLAADATGWLIWKFTYTSNNMTLRQTAFDSWDNRTSATYA